MDVIYFESAAAFRDWLLHHHDQAAEVWVGFYKVGADQQGITYKQSVDEALCFGWIDGVRRSVDDSRYANRFTPRKTGSNWSLINIARVAELTDEGRMHPAGLKAFEARKQDRSGVYSFEQKDAAELSEAERQTFQQQAAAWAFFEQQAPSYRRAALWWVVSAKQPATRERRLAKLIEESGRGERLAQFVSRKKDTSAS